MELREGYKHTEVGVIPEDWAIGSLESVTHQGIRNGIVDGPFGSNLKTIHYRKSGVPIVTSGYVTDGHFYADSYLYVDPEKFRAEKRSAVSPGDIVMAKIGARCGASAILPASHPVGILSGNALKISVDESRHSTFYVWQVLWDLYLDGRMDVLRTVGAQPAISMANLKKHQIPLPPQTEQRAIATALSDVDALLAKIDQLIAKKRDLKQAAMQQLLTGQTRLPGFSGEWEVRRLGDMAETGSGGTPPSSVTAYYDGDIPWVSIADMTGGGKIIFTTERNLTLEGVKNSAAQIFPVGTVLYAMYASIGECSIAGVPLCSSQAILGIRTKAMLDKDFLFYHLTSLKSIIKTMGQQGTQSNLNAGMVRAFEIKLPKLAEQTAIATVLSDMDAELAALEVRRDKTRALKQGMMQELLTGRIRLV
jgi:type I restriction enzyme S subunit